MQIKVYMKDKENVSPSLFENWEKGLYATFSNIGEIKDVETDYDLLNTGNLIHRFRKDRFYLVIED